MPLAVDWKALQREYEDNPEVTHYQLARKYNINRNTVARHAQLYAWRKPGEEKRHAAKAATRITQAAEAALASTCREVAAQVTASTEKTLKDLAPWIEEMRASHVKYIVGLSSKALKRLDKIFESKEPDTPKDEQFSAAAIEKHDTIIRRNLGMGEGNAAGSLNVNVLIAGGRSVSEKSAVAKEI